MFSGLLLGSYNKEKKKKRVRKHLGKIQEKIGVNVKTIQSSEKSQEVPQRGMCVHVCVMGSSYVGKTGLNSMMQTRLALNSESSFLDLSSIGIAGV